MPLGIGSALWGAILPIAETNQFTNPSYEFGTTGAVAIQSATLGTSSDFQRYGAWSLIVTPNSNGTSGVNCGTITTGNGTTYSISAWIRGASGVPMRMGLGDGNGVNLTSGTTTFTGGGTWHWYTCTLTEAAQGNRGLVIQKTSGNSVVPFYVDGIKISPWTDGIDRTTTYIDGDQPGGTWLGAQHNSQSYRSGQYRGGGSVIALADLGLSVDQMIGVGMPPIENSAQSYAITDGAQFQRQRAASRKFTLTAKPINGTSLGDFHVVRRTLIDAFKPDLVTPQQPIRFLYVGGQGTVQYDAYYEKGLELGNMDGPIAENAAISFTGYDPYWYAPTQQGTTLSPRTNLGSVNFLAKRSPLGKWGTLGQSNGTTIVTLIPSVNALAINDGGTVFFGGRWGSIAGTSYRAAGMYFPNSNLFGTLTGGTVASAGGTVYALAFAPYGSLYIGGFIDTLGGTIAHGIGIWNGAFGSLVGGTLTSNDIVRSLMIASNGSLWMGGSISNIGGTTARHLVFWKNGAAGTPTGGSIGGPSVNALAEGLDHKIYFGGNFSQAFGKTTRFVGYWNGAGGTLSGGTLNNQVFAIDTAPNGQEIIGGQFTTVDTTTALRTLSYNGVSYTTQGQGLDNIVFSLLVDQSSGNVWAGGQFSNTGAIPLTGGLAQYNGYNWLPSDIDLATYFGTVFALAQANDNTLYIGGEFFGTATCASVGTIVNTGRAITYPNLRLRNLSASGTARVFQLLNTLTNANIYFNYVMQPGEQADLILQPGQRSFQSSAQGNIFGLILPGSNLATFNLLSGTNYVSFFSDNDSLEASFFWQPKGWSIDSGTVQ